MIGPELEPNAYVYLDDIIVCSATFEEHVEHLKEIFRRIREAGLRINKQNCEFCKPEIEYLGHLVTKDGIKMNEAKVKSIKELKSPTNIKEVRRFIGMTSWYRKFIPKYSEVIAPLRKLLKKNIRFQWEEEQKQAFENIKELLISDPILTRADFTKPFILQTDASDKGLGAVLIQEYDNMPKVVTYASRSLIPAETKYSWGRLSAHT